MAANDVRNLLAVMSLLQRETKVSIPHVARLLGFEEDETRAYLETLIFCFDELQIRLEVEENHASLIGQPRQRILRLTKYETTLLIEALKAAGIDSDDPLSRILVQAKGALEASDETFEGRICFVNRIGISNVLYTLAEACEERLPVELDYQNEGSETSRRRTVEPQGLTIERSLWYLWAYCRSAQDYRKFRVDRIKSAEKLDEPFLPNKEALFTEGKLEAHIECAPDASTNSWPGLEKVHTLQDGSFEARIPWFGGMWLPKKIVATGGKVTPLSPPQLIEQTRAYAESLLAGDPGTEE